MNRLTSGMVSLCALLLAVGCSGDPTEALRGGADRLVASPSSVFLELGETKSVDVGAVDAQGNQLDLDYQVTATQGGITVKRDSSFRGEFLNDSTFTVPPTAQQFRFTVTASAYGPGSFTVNAGGKDVTVPVQVIAQNAIAATFSNAAPALTEVVTLTAPAGVTFAQTSNSNSTTALDSTTNARRVRSLARASSRGRAVAPHLPGIRLLGNSNPILSPTTATFASASGADTPVIRRATIEYSCD